MSKWICQCKAINPNGSYRCHNCQLPSGSNPALGAPYEGGDLYQKVADRTGTTRQFVKSNALCLMYSLAALTSTKPMEEQLVDYINTIKGLVKS